MAKIMTEEEIRRIMETWQHWYEMHDVPVTIDMDMVLPQPPGYDFPVLNAQGMHPNSVNSAFKKALDLYGIVCFSAPGSIGGVPYDFVDAMGTNDRTADSGDYVFWVKKHFKVRRDGSFKRKSFDSRMTAEEAMLYHLYHLWQYSHRYIGHHYSDFHPCGGSKGCRGLRWDLQDIKVCLD